MLKTSSNYHNYNYDDKNNHILLKQQVSCNFLFLDRIRNDLPNYLSEREADGVSVMNWYHRQFRDTARERYFKNMNMAMYFHSMIADYYLGKLQRVVVVLKKEEH